MRAFLQRHEVERRPVDLNLLATEVIGLVRHDAVLRRVKLVVEPGETSPTVLGDRIQLQQALLNLLLNALDALDESVPHERLVTVCVRLVDSRQVEVAVSDNGRGIPADNLPRIFEPFFTFKPKGMGIGLSISRTIIESHGGQIRAENNPGGGATFRCTLPVTAGPE